MQKIINKILGIGLVSLAVVFAVTYSIKTSFASAPSGIPARVATSSTMTIGPQESLVWFYGNNSMPSSNCSARIISTIGNNIAITFGGTSSSTATSTISKTVASGNIQLASTTVAYDSGIYGCGYLGLYGYGATSTITITETQ